MFEGSQRSGSGIPASAVKPSLTAGILFPVLTVVALLFGYYEGILNIIDNECVMTYMWAGYGEVDVPTSPLNARYKLQIYREGNKVSPQFSWASGNVPVFFVPGNAGHANQGRSLGSVLAHLDKTGHTPASVDVFNVHFNEEHGAWRGHMLERQAQYVNDCIQFVLSKYKEFDTSGHPPKSVILVGHSMGGIVARAVLLRPDYEIGTVRTIFTLSSPHTAPPVWVDRSLVRLYNALNVQYQDMDPITKDVVMIALHGGDRDVLVHAGLNDIQRATGSHSNTLGLASTSVVDVWVPIDHQCSVWCNQMVTKLAHVILHIVDSKAKQDTQSTANKMILLRHELGHTIAPLLNDHVHQKVLAPLAHAEGMMPIPYEDSGLTRAPLSKVDHLTFRHTPEHQIYRLDAKHFRHEDIGHPAFFMWTDLVPGKDFHIYASDFAASDIIDLSGVVVPVPGQGAFDRRYMMKISQHQMSITDTIWFKFSDEIMKNDQDIFFAAQFYNPGVVSYNVTSSLVSPSHLEFGAAHSEKISLHIHNVHAHHLVHWIDVKAADTPQCAQLSTQPLLLQSTPGMREDVWVRNITRRGVVHLKFHQSHPEHVPDLERGVTVHLFVPRGCAYTVDVGVSVRQSIGNYFRTDTATLIPAAFNIALLLLARQLLYYGEGSAIPSLSSRYLLPAAGHPLSHIPAIALIVPAIILFCIVWFTSLVAAHRYSVWMSAHVLGYGLVMTLNLVFSVLISILSKVGLFSGSQPIATERFLSLAHLLPVIAAGGFALTLSESPPMVYLLLYVLGVVGDTYVRVSKPSDSLATDRARHSYDQQLYRLQQALLVVAAITILPYFAGLNLFIMNFMQVGSLVTDLPVTIDAMLVPLFALSMYCGVCRIPRRPTSRIIGYLLTFAALYNTAIALTIPCEVTTTAAIAWLAILLGTVMDHWSQDGLNPKTHAA